MSTYIGALSVFIGALFFSAKAVIVKLIYKEAPEVDHVVLLALRMGFSLPFFLAVSLFHNFGNKPKEGLNKKNALAVVLIGILGYYLSSIFDFWGLEYVTASLERLILFVYPTIVVVISMVVFRKRANPVIIWSLILAYLGIFIVLLGEDISSNRNILKGSLLIFLAAITYASYLVASERMINKLGNAQYTSLVMSVASVCVLLHFFVVHDLKDLILPIEVLLQAVGMAVFCTVIPAFLISQGIKYIGASNAAIIASIGPVSTIFLAHYFLGETIQNVQILGTLFVIAGVVLTSLYSKAQKG